MNGVKNGVVKVKRVYNLIMYTNPYGDYREGFNIGIFESFEEAENVAKRYLNEVQGFCDYEFEYEITKVNIIGDENGNVFYRFSGWNVDENGDEKDIIYSDCYTIKDIAKGDFEKTKQKISRAEWSLDKCILGECHWEEGFVRIFNETEKTFCYTYFRIVGEFPANEVIKMLGVEPYKNDVSGEYVNLDFALCDNYDVLVENQMRKTIEPFIGKVDVLNSIREKYDVKFYLEVVPEIYVDETHPILAPPLDVMEFCVKTQTEIDIDLYVFEN